MATESEIQDMSDVGDMYREWDAEKKERKRIAFEDNVNELAASGLSWRWLNQHHIRIAGVVDFWPSTGRFMSLPGLHGGRYDKGLGVHRAIEVAKRETESEG